MTTSARDGTGANLLINTTGAVLVTIVPGLQGQAAMAVSDSLFGGSPAVQMILGLLFWAFLAVAVAVATTTSANAFTVVLNGHLEEIALRRLLGASAARERVRLGRLGLRVAAVGCVAGAGIGVLLLLILAPSEIASPSTLASAAIGLIAIFTATVIGIRRAADGILAAAPITGLRLTRIDEAVRADGTRPAVPVLFVVGLVILVASVPASLVSPFAIFIGVVGGIATMLGSLAAMAHLLPVVLRLVRYVLPAHGTASLAIHLLATRPGAAARAATGVFTGTAVVATFTVALSTLTGALFAAYEGDPHGAAAISTLQQVTAGIGLMISLIVVLSGIGLATSLVHSARQREREIATLRILGHSAVDASRTIRAEAALLALSAIVPGLLLGVITGWVGAQDVLGAVRELGVLPPVLPLPLLLAAAAGAALLVVVVTRLTSRTVLSAPPIRALADA